MFASPQSQARDVSDSSRPEVLRPSALPWGIYGCCRDGQRTSCSHSYAPRKSHSLPVRAGRQPGLWGKVPCRAKGTACTLCFSGWDSRLPSWIWSQGAEEQWDGAESLDWPAKPPTHTSVGPCPGVHGVAYGIPGASPKNLSCSARLTLRAVLAHASRH